TEGTRLGTPAEPTAFDGVVYAAWLPSSGSAGTYWTARTGTRTLDFGGAQLSGDAQPVFQTLDPLPFASTHASPTTVSW
ncbi:hypothetical protein ACC691_41140, partial [Rhizobium johnstonii]|uniref:hypothetical protein n=1 Tax=Rhizobium johnstonii TaxID=3019933 RepID=UPI003F9C7EE1